MTDLNIDEYISSGIVQYYVLGVATAEERIAFEKICMQYEEVSAAKENFEEQLKQFALRKREDPPPVIKSQVMAGIDIESVGQISKIEKEINTYANNAVEMLSVEKTRAIDHQLFTTRKNISSRAPQILATVSVVLLLVSVGLNFLFFNRLARAEEQSQSALLRQQQIVADNEVLQSEILSYEKLADLQRDEQVIPVKLITAATDTDTGRVAATVYWNAITKEVFVMIDFLPKAGKDAHYHLWAKVSDGYADIGKVDIPEAGGVVKMQSAAHPDEFLLTIENTETPKNPSLEKVWAAAKFK